MKNPSKLRSDMEGTITKRKCVSKSQCNGEVKFGWDWPKWAEGDRRNHFGLEEMKAWTKELATDMLRVLERRLDLESNQVDLGRVGYGDQRAKAGDNAKDIVEIDFAVV